MSFAAQPQQQLAPGFVLAHSHASQPHAVFTQSRPQTPSAARLMPVTPSRAHTPARSRPQTPLHEPAPPHTHSRSRVGSVHTAHGDLMHPYRVASSAQTASMMPAVAANGTPLRVRPSEPPLMGAEGSPRLEGTFTLLDEVRFRGERASSSASRE